jgi:hypothetical protein
LIKLQVRGSSSWLGRFTLTPIKEAEYMAATGFLTQIFRQVLASWLGPYMAERGEFELPVPIREKSDGIRLRFATSRRTAKLYRPAAHF